MEQAKIETPEPKHELVPVTGFALQIKLDNLKEMAEQRELFERFIRVQLKDGTDFGTLPNTEKPSLWKPGAEKLANLFLLGSRIISETKEINIKDNWAMFSYTIEIFHIPSGKAISQCEGICNSQEKKYKERKIMEWDDRQKKKVFKGMEPTPVGDIINTLAKMAQKRAYVGAVIIATKASDFFNHDLAEDEENYDDSAPPPANHVYVPSAPKVTPSEKTMGAEAAQLKTGIVTTAKPVDNVRQTLSLQINEARKDLGWSPFELVKFVKDNTGKSTPDLTNDEMRMLIETMDRIGARK